MKINESPADRLKTVTLGLFSHQSGPNVILGAFVTATLQSATGLAPWWWAVIAGSVWAVWVLIYAVADEVKAHIEEQQNRLLSEQSDFYGIE